MLKTILHFINYWYMRYLLVTELYMVEKWERVMIHIVFFILLSFLSLFNTSVIVRFVSSITESFFQQDIMKSSSLHGIKNSGLHSEF